jgi:hypothetical protein
MTVLDTRLEETLSVSRKVCSAATIYFEKDQAGFIPKTIFSIDHPILATCSAPLIWSTKKCGICQMDGSSLVLIGTIVIKNAVQNLEKYAAKHTVFFPEFSFDRLAITFKSILKNSLIIHEENTNKNHKRVVSVYVIQIHVDLHKF